MMTEFTLKKSWNSTFQKRTVITNPFSVNLLNLAFGTGEQEELIDLQEDNEPKIRHRDCARTPLRSSGLGALEVRTTRID